MRIVSCMSADNMPATPGLPNDVVLPVTNIRDLEAVEQALASSTAVKDSMVCNIQDMAEFLNNFTGQ